MGKQNRPSRRAHRSLPKPPLNFFHVAAPVCGKQPTLDIAMKAAMRPVDNTRDMSVLDRIEMDIVDMALQIGIIANGVLPIATLPDTLLSLAHLACGSRQGSKAAREAALDQAPAGGKISVSFRQCPNRVNVIGQDADRDGFERAALLDGSIDNSQSINLVQQQPARPVGENDGEEENAAFEFRSDVSWHEQIILYKNGGHAAKSGFAHPTKVLNYFNTCRIRPCR